MKLYIGIDWSQSKHDVCILNHAGAIQAQAVIAHSQTGFGKFERLRMQMEVRPDDCLIGLETAHNILVDFLWDCGYAQIYVLPPSLGKGSQTRFRSSAARDDPWDAYLIAEILRTDRGRLQVWKQIVV